MSRFYTGDELGALKAVSYAPGAISEELKTTTTVLVPGSSSGRSKIVQKLALHRASSSNSLLAAVFADGSSTAYRVEENSRLSIVHEWSEKKLKEGQRFVGLAASEGTVYSCTSNGALRATTFGQAETDPSSSVASLPMRLCEWRLSTDGHTFAYGGEEVELSLWDLEKAFSQNTLPESIDSKKRRRGDQLLSGELWRAKNVPNDHLSLRQPVHNTALTYLQPSSSHAHQHLLVGTASGHVRRYDTRTARRPVADWKAIGKVGGISTVEKGFHEHEVFVADRGSTLSALDIRTGRVVYSYKGISGAVTSIAPTNSLMVSASQDRYLRLHSTFGLPAEASQPQDHRGEVLTKTYMKVVPTVVVWDGEVETKQSSSDLNQIDGEDEVWDAMQTAESDSDDEGKGNHRKEKKARPT